MRRDHVIVQRTNLTPAHRTVNAADHISSPEMRSAVRR
jgi:hypothetical protein